MTCKCGGGVDQRHSALARCLADLITTHTGIKAYIEQSIPGIAQPTQPGRTEGSRMDTVVELRSITYYIDTAIVTPFSSIARLISAASARPGYMAKCDEKSSTDTPASTWPHSFKSPQGDRDTTPESSSNTPTTTRTTRRQPFGTPGQPFKPPCTTASLNNNSGRSPRDRQDYRLTHASRIGSVFNHVYPASAID